jgi:hypothetical protein
VCALWVQKAKIEGKVKDEAYECNIVKATAVALTIGSRKRSEVKKRDELGRWFLNQM